MLPLGISPQQTKTSCRIQHRNELFVIGVIDTIGIVYPIQISNNPDGVVVPGVDFMP